MAKRVLFTDQARADIAAIEQQTALQILKTVARFVASGQGDVKRLQGVDSPLLVTQSRTSPRNHAKLGASHNRRRETYPARHKP